MEFSKPLRSCTYMLLAQFNKLPPCFSMKAVNFSKCGVSNVSTGDGNAWCGSSTQRRHLHTHRPCTPLPSPSSFWVIRMGSVLARLFYMLGPLRIVLMQQWMGRGRGIQASSKSCWGAGPVASTPLGLLRHGAGQGPGEACFPEVGAAGLDDEGQLLGDLAQRLLVEAHARRWQRLHRFWGGWGELSLLLGAHLGRGEEGQGQGPLVWQVVWGQRLTQQAQAKDAPRRTLDHDPGLLLLSVGLLAPLVCLKMRTAAERRAEGSVSVCFTGYPTVPQPPTYCSPTTLILWQIRLEVFILC